MNDKIYEKIKKLMALSSGSNFEDESNTALTMASALMEQYNVTVKDLDEYSRSQEFGKLTNEQKEEAHLYKIWEKQLMASIAALFNCELVVSHEIARKSTMHILGREGNVRTAIAMNDWIVNKIKADAKTKYPGRQIASRNSYALGVVNNIISRVDKMIGERTKKAEQNGWGLVPVNEVKEFLRKQYPDCRVSHTKGTMSDTSAFGAGVADGANIGLNKQFGLKSIA